MSSATTVQPDASNQESGLKSRLVILEKLRESSRNLLESDESVARWHANLARSSQLIADSWIKRLNIQNTGSTLYITGMIKNSGNTDISNAVVIVTLDIGDDTVDKDDQFIVAFEPASIHSGSRRL